MAETPIDFQCWLGSYEIWHEDKIPPKIKSQNTPPNIPHLVQTGALKIVRPRREALGMAVELLVKTEMPKWHAEYIRRMRVGGDAADKKLKSQEFDLDREEFANLERNVLAIARHTGMLWPAFRSHSDPADDRIQYEPLDRWIRLAQNIQYMFSRRVKYREQKRDIELPVGGLMICLSFKSGVPAMHIRPGSTEDALIYRAAQMIAEGTTRHTCAHCGTPFLGGGIAAGSKNKRGDARFCDDKCRSGYHNERRRKAARKAKL
jgi:hypothetical protein